MVAKVRQAGLGGESPPVDVAAAPARVRNRSREQYRFRPGSRLAVKMIGRRKDRLAFLEQLARSGDPAAAADQIGLPLFEAFRYRDADPKFAAEWQAAVNYAWERVESRVLAALLTAAKSPVSVGSGEGQIDVRLALAIVNRRDKPAAPAAARVADGPAAARLRAELRALAGLGEDSN